ncbi:MAG: YdeI/OmpD-associated family protein [Rhodanobacteraceae bacterium]|nr:YdeI/OmpD-associated family protein [Rhodanobacteraceae bacterium]
MPTTDPRIDAYIAKSAEFAQPILLRLRVLVHGALPSVEESIKWGMPHFLHEGRILCGMAAFKAHCAFGFWAGKAVVGEAASDEAMGQLGRITSLKELPSATTMKAWVKAALAARASTTAAPKVKKVAKTSPHDTLPDELAAAFATKTHAAARKHFESFPPSAKRDYIEWIVTAKQPATRERRLAQTLEWLAECKRRNWKYADC